MKNRSYTPNSKPNVQLEELADPSIYAGALYGRPLRATRSGPLYNAFPYPTKISPEAIALFIAAHTNPGDTVFDGFAGSGTTGLAALLCESPPSHLRAEAENLGLDLEWGVRNAILYELGALGSLVARTLTNPPNPADFRKAANEVLSDVGQLYGWLYDAKEVPECDGNIRYTIWSDWVRCPGCMREVSLWDGCVGLRPARIGPDFVCPRCGYLGPVDEAERLVLTSRDDVLEHSQEIRARSPVRIYGTSDRRNWSRPPTEGDLDLLRRIELEPIPDSVPRVSIPWGDLHRSGYHTGITHVHHFYTRRNLIAFGRLWERTESYANKLREALRFWLLSYNASHTTMMTRVVAKSAQDELAVTSAQPGVLYISGLPVEKNVFDGLRRKLVTISKAFDVIHGRRGIVNVIESSSCQVDLPDASIDYVFTDPPFGGNIPYAEVNFINEAWLGRYTDQTDEIIVSSHQRKTMTEYTDLLTRALTEANRILKADGKATLVFHSASADVWNALQRAYTEAGLGVKHASILHKTQGSFMQVNARGSVKGDPVVLLAKQQCGDATTNGSVWSMADGLHRAAAHHVDPEERTARRLYSRLVSQLLVNHEEVSVDASAFYTWHAELQEAKARSIAGD